MCMCVLGCNYGRFFKLLFLLEQTVASDSAEKIDKFNYESMHAYTVCGIVNKAYECQCIYIHFVKKELDEK